MRPATASDIPRLTTLATAAEIPIPAGGVRHLRGEVDEQLTARLAALLSRPDRTVLVAEGEDGHELSGMVVVADDEIGAIMPVPALRASHLIVAPGHRRKGVGRALLAAATQMAEERGIDHVIATSMPGSRDVNRYLARLGFVPLVSRRIASTAVLKRSLGPAPEKVPIQRRASILRRGRSSAAIAMRTAQRGA